MSSSGAGAVRDAGTVPVRVQVIDVEPFFLDLTVPTYISAGDLARRVVLDTGLGAHWPDGSRRRFWLRARGRVLEDGERLDDVGVVPYELLHVLPEPPPGSGVLERPPEYPRRTKGFGRSLPRLLAGSLWLGVWACAWSIGLVATRGIAMLVLPALAAAVWCVSLARQLVGGPAPSLKVPLLGSLIYLPLLGSVGLPRVLLGFGPWSDLLWIVVPGVLMGGMGLLVGWLAWFGAVEPLPEQTRAEVVHKEAESVHPCGICGLPVAADVRVRCRQGCGGVFHSGCYGARSAVSKGTGCPLCGSAGIG